MKCPNCGESMKDGQMYCEKCGNEIQIVPEFEPEIENSIYATLSDVADEIGKENAFSDSGTQSEMDTKIEIKKHKEVRKMPFIIAGILFLAAVAFIYRFWSTQPEKLYQKAMTQMENGAYSEALDLLENAVSKAENNPVYLNSMAECCLQTEDTARAADICEMIIQIDGANEEAYSRLIRIYKNQNKFEEIDTLLKKCDSREIVNLYLDYLANEPAFDMESGVYREKITVKLIANAAGTLYYTLDGSTPTVNSQIYTTPFSLESGDFTIKALFVNQYGVVSDVAKASYHIDVSRPDAPGVSPESGEYNAPGYISVEVPQNCKVYFTMDGSDPDNTSAMYEVPFWMPAGNSNFKFVVYDEGGVCGEITDRQYNLKLNAALSMEAAANQLLLTLKNAGVLLNLQGDVAEKSGKNIYTYKYALTIDNRNFYLYREYYEEASGNSSVTGNDYVVDYMTGECYRAIRREDKTFELQTVNDMVKKS